MKYTNFNSFIALEYKFTLVSMLSYRSFNIVSHLFKCHFEVETLKNTLYKNVYSTKFVGNCILKFLNSSFLQRPVVTTVVPKLELRIALRIQNSELELRTQILELRIRIRIQNLELRIRTHIQGTFPASPKQDSPDLYVKTLFQTSNRLKLFQINRLCSCNLTLFTNFKCRSSTAFNYRKTCTYESSGFGTTGCVPQNRYAS